jgi:hypothetical protein
MSDIKPDYDEQQCYYCKQWFPAPVSLHHAEDVCLANQQAKETE